MMTEEQIGYLNEKLNHVLAELSQTQEELRATKEELQVTQEKLHVAQERIEELEKQKTPPPAFVKATVKKPEEGERKARKKRDAQFNRGRHTMQATQSMEHRSSPGKSDRDLANGHALAFPSDPALSGNAASCASLGG